MRVREAEDKCFQNYCKKTGFRQLCADPSNNFYFKLKKIIDDEYLYK